MTLILVAAAALVLNSVLLVKKRDSLEIAMTDNRTWVASQLEADHARLLVAVRAGLYDMLDKRDADFAGIRLAYDIFHSRLSTFASVTDDWEAGHAQAARIEELFSWRAGLADRVDAEGFATREGLTEFLSAAESGGAQIRAATLSALAGLAEQRDQNRETERRLLSVYLAISLGLLLLMLLSAALSARLWAQLARSAVANQRVADLLKRMLDTAPAAILLTNAEGRVIQANPEADRLFGRNLRIDTAAKKATGQAQDVCISPLLRDPWRDRIDEGRYRSRVLGPEDASIPVDISVVRASQRDGDSFLVFFLTDMTLEERAEQEMRVARQTSEALSAAKDRFFEAVSHEMRTPLHGCVVALDRMEGIDIPARHREFLEIARGSVERLHATVEDVLDVTRLGDPGQAAAPFHPTLAVQQVIAAFQPEVSAMGTGIDLEICGEQAEPLLGKRPAFARTLEKYIRLALDAARGVPVHVCLQYAPASADGIVVLTVSIDSTGAASSCRMPGPAAVPGRAPARASRTEGLQEAAARTLVRAMGAEAHSEFPPDGGGRFRFELVLPTVQGDGAPETSFPTRELHWGGRALVVDDNPTNVVLMRSMVESLGFDVDEGADGIQAVEMAGRRPYDLIVLDYRMPGATGAEAAARIREASVSAGAVIVCVTAILESVPAHERDSDDIDLFLAKPVTAEGLVAVLKDIGAAATETEGQGASTDWQTESNAIDFDGLCDLLGRESAERLLADAFDQIRLAEDALQDANRDRQDRIAVVHDAIASAGMIGLGRLAQLLRSAHIELETGQPAQSIGVLPALIADVQLCEKMASALGIPNAARRVN